MSRYLVLGTDETRRDKIRPDFYRPICPYRVDSEVMLLVYDGLKCAEVDQMLEWVAADEIEIENERQRERECW